MPDFLTHTQLLSPRRKFGLLRETILVDEN